MIVEHGVKSPCLYKMLFDFKTKSFKIRLPKSKTYKMLSDFKMKNQVHLAHLKVPSDSHRPMGANLKKTTIYPWVLFRSH